MKLFPLATYLTILATLLISTTANYPSVTGQMQENEIPSFGGIQPKFTPTDAERTPPLPPANALSVTDMPPLTLEKQNETQAQVSNQLSSEIDQPSFNDTNKVDQGMVAQDDTAAQDEIPLEKGSEKGELCPTGYELDKSYSDTTEPLCLPVNTNRENTTQIPIEQEPTNGTSEDTQTEGQIINQLS